MKRQHLSILTALALTVGCHAGAQQAYPWRNLSANDALQAVRLFESSTQYTAPVSVEPCPPLDDPYEFDMSSEYVVRDSTFAYYVSAYTPTRLARLNTVFMTNLPAFYFPLAYDVTVLKQHQLTAQQMQTIADAFVRAHYPDISVLQPAATDGAVFAPEPMNFRARYLFHYAQMLPDGTIGPSACEVGVDAVYGRVVTYSQAYYPILVTPTNNTLSDAQCWQIATNAILKHTGQYESGGTLYVNAPDSMGLEGLERDYHFTDPQDVFDVHYSVSVNALTGALIVSSETQGGGAKDNKTMHPKGPMGSSKLPHYMTQATPGKPLPFVRNGRSAMLSVPPLQIGGTTYLYVGYLTCGTEGAKVNYKNSRHLTVSGKNLELALNPASLNYTFNGGKKRMSARPIFVRGHCYVPLDVAQQILPGTLLYDSKDQTVCYDPPCAAKAITAAK